MPAPASATCVFTIDPARLTLRRDLRVDPGIAARLLRRTAQPAPEPAPVVAPVAFRALERNSFVQVAALRRVAPVAAPVAVAAPAAGPILARRAMRFNPAVLATANIHLRPEVFGTATPAPPPPPPPPPERDEI